MPPLNGCLNDIRHFEAWLGQGPGAQATAIQTLTNADATHDTEMPAACRTTAA